jgi:hypothetical protein
MTQSLGARASLPAPLLPGEDMLFRKDYMLWVQSETKSIVGQVLITNAALRFLPAIEQRDDVGWKVYLMAIHRVLRLGNVGGFFAFEIQCKDFRGTLADSLLASPFPFSRACAVYRISTTEPESENKIWSMLDAYKNDFALFHFKAMPT